MSFTKREGEMFALPNNKPRKQWRRTDKCRDDVKKVVKAREI